MQPPGEQSEGEVDLGSLLLSLCCNEQGMLLDIQGQLSCLLFLSSHRVLSGQFGQRGDFFFPLPSVLPRVPVYWGRKGAVLGLLSCSILGCDRSRFGTLVSLGTGWEKSTVPWLSWC